jgi:DNA-binding NtrC family response regulator
MSLAPELILYTQDPDLVRRTRAFSRLLAQVRHVGDPDRLEPVLQQTGPVILMMDLRAKECRELLEQIHTEQPDFLIIALGVAQSEPLREAEQLGIYAVEELDLDRRRFQALLARAFDYQKALQENRDFREISGAMTDLPPRVESTQSSGSPGRTLP